MNLWRRFTAWLGSLIAQPNPYDNFPEGTQPLSEEDRAELLAPPTVPISPPPKGNP